MVLRVFRHLFGLEVPARGDPPYHALIQPQEEGFFGFFPGVGAQADDRLSYTHYPPIIAPLCNLWRYFATHPSILPSRALWHTDRGASSPPNRTLPHSEVLGVEYQQPDPLVR